MIQSNHRRAGFSLIEMLCVMVLLILVMSLSTLLLRAILKVEQVQTAGFDRLLQEKALAEQFRADVARAEAAPPEWDGLRASKSCLILSMPDGEHVVYQWRDQALFRQVHMQQKNAETRLPIGAHIEIEFSLANPKLARLRLIALREGRRVEGEALEIAAALGGDWR